MKLINISDETVSLIPTKFSVREKWYWFGYKAIVRLHLKLDEFQKIFNNGGVCEIVYADRKFRAVIFNSETETVYDYVSNVYKTFVCVKLNLK
jgi:hypothetical protein